METPLSDFASQIQGAIDELERAQQLLSDLEPYGLSGKDEASLHTRVQYTLAMLRTPYPPNVQRIIDDEAARMDAADAAYDKTLY